MNPSHEQVLADIERLVGTEVALDETDTRIAEVLGVPPDYYFAYLLVWGAIEAQAQAIGLTDPHWQRRTSETSGALATVTSLVRCIGRLAATAHGHAEAGRCEDAAGGTARILGAVLQLGQALRDLDAAVAGPPTPTNGMSGVSRG